MRGLVTLRAVAASALAFAALIGAGELAFDTAEPEQEARPLLETCMHEQCERPRAVAVKTSQ